VSDKASPQEGVTTKPSLPATAARYAAIVFGAIAGSALLRLLLHRVLAMPGDVQLRGPIILASLLGFFWFALGFLVFARSSARRIDFPRARTPSPTGTRTVFRTITLALVVACLMAMTAWVGLYLNDQIFYSRSLPWISPLITVQEYGSGKASQMFPCQAEGFDTGCEAYKWIPAFLIANGLCYFPVALLSLFSWRLSDTVRKTVRTGVQGFARWSVGAVTVGLVALQIMHGLNRDTHDSLYPHPGIAHWHFGAWELVNDITGTLVTVAGLSFPFYFYLALRRADGLLEARTRLAAATSLAATLLVALMLGDVY
jgi:hypothetical protein